MVEEQVGMCVRLGGLEGRAGFITRNANASQRTKNHAEHKSESEISNFMKLKF